MQLRMCTLSYSYRSNRENNLNLCQAHIVPTLLLLCVRVYWRVLSNIARRGGVGGGEAEARYNSEAEWEGTWWWKIKLKYDTGPGGVMTEFCP